LELLSL